MKKEVEGLSKSWGSRLWSTTKIASSAVRLAARRVTGIEGEQDGALGAAIANELDQMKGMAMKVGQILSYFDGVLPEQAHQALQSLQRGAQPVAFSQMSEVIREAFGAPYDQLFDSFEVSPIAAASIGQVYRASFQGRPVAVKVQYPNIQETIHTDFQRMKGVSRLASLATSIDGPSLVAELQARFSEECDYQREAIHQKAFRRAFSSQPSIKIPGVIEERTRSTVITTEWCEGDDFYNFLSKATPERRSEVGMLLTSFALRSLFELGAINADPHPGNYLFPETREVVFLDFGCVRHFDAQFVEANRRLILIVIEGQRHLFDHALIEAGMVAKPERFDFDFHWEFLRQEYSPYRAPRFEFTSDFLKKHMEASKAKNPNFRSMAIPPQWIWMERLLFGLHAVLARLGAQGDFRELMRSSLSLKRTGLPAEKGANITPQEMPRI
jgi:predicted unusual protein kinase regulating ubiquinone biosynthesis (AarF/ABC1/UbiB family)